MDHRTIALATFLSATACQKNEISEDINGDIDSPQEEASEPGTKKSGNALKILENNCYSCHGENGSDLGNFGFVLNVAQLIDEGLIIPGDATNSPLFDRIVRTGAGAMPYQQSPLADSQIQTIRRWINVELVEDPPENDRDFVKISEEFQWMGEDLDSLPQNKRPYIRYLTITHLYNAGVLEDELEVYRLAMSKLINNLSMGPDIVVPVSINPPLNTIYRIDLTDYNWQDGGGSQSLSPIWDDLIAANPYAVLHVNTPEAMKVVTQTRTPVPYVRGDWFGANASSAPLYYDLLRLPEDIAVLEEFLGVDVTANIESGYAARAGFLESGVSDFNRVIERHDDSFFGTYWKSYDFNSNEGVQNVYARPLGPGDGPADFSHAGGEMIFSLPNELHGYMLTDAAGIRLDVAPTEIVRDEDEGEVVGGLSCMSCHEEGIIAKTDKTRMRVQATGDAFVRSDFDRIMDLYVESWIMDGLIEEDQQAFARSIAETGNSVTEPDTTLALAKEFEAAVSLKRGAAELGMTEEQLRNILNSDGEVGDLLANFRGGNQIDRSTFNSIFNEVACLVNYGMPLVATDGCDFPDYNNDRIDISASTSRTTQTRVEPLPATLKRD